jgi:hypothetical protein
MKLFIEWLESLNLPSYHTDEAEHYRLQIAIRDMVEEQNTTLQQLIDYFKPKIKEIADLLQKVTSFYGYQWIYGYGLLNSLLTLNWADELPGQAYKIFYGQIEEVNEILKEHLPDTTHETDKSNQWRILHVLQFLDFLLSNEIRSAFDKAKENTLHK